MRWQFPVALWGLALVPVFWFVDHLLARHAPRISYPDISLLPSPGASAHVNVLAPRGMRALAIACIVLGLAHPEAAYVGGTTTIEGIDICLALDLSRSMRAEDLAPNRLAAAKATLRDFVQARENDRIALVVFAGDAFLQAPLTLDHGAVDRLIEAADFSLAELDGTAIGDALVKSSARLKDSTGESRVVVLLTDGENNRGEVDPENATRIAAALGIRVYTIGVGSEAGARIPIDDPVFGADFVRGADGRPLVTKLDEEALQAIAQATGGKYFNARDRQTLADVLGEIDRLERSAIEVYRPPAYESVARWFYVAAFVLVLTEGLLSRTWLRVLP
ncbi:VWA domain-containing protein [Candidatus Poribacteria bacterium]|nr:VWA domain-containing protein [Candidatus Poribacteria bacterium]MBT5535162.1 VWA domain-containing protein [Candidatus Poribacteria bacterium]MBT5709506.1 VWA domain-containing protein [Candidatus Poribacteria bacterium]MBT7808403.1 VWA domain-containing protein [Candidatus Poribacteria bacterium]